MREQMEERLWFGVRFGEAEEAELETERPGRDEVDDTAEETDGGPVHSSAVAAGAELADQLAADDADDADSHSAVRTAAGDGPGLMLTSVQDEEELA